MNPEITDRDAPWWRQRWVQGAGLITLAQVLTIWVLSPRNQPVEPKLAPARQMFQDAAASGDGETFKRLLTPSLMPSWNDFSGSAWLTRAPAEVTFEPLSVEIRPLPPVVLALVPMEWPTRDDHLHELAWQWTLPTFQPGIPKPPPIPLPALGSVRVVEGLAGWTLPLTTAVPVPPPGPAPRSVTVRVVVDLQGRVAVPPVVWIDSGVPEADALALQWAAGLEFLPSATPPAPRMAGAEEWRSGLLVIEWAVPSGPEPKSEQGAKS
ncbi:MAG: hypothetical protein JNK85_02245 [Verrucomicrobiales bacterium]|nr:hypothetical protein [Verrucomicrobiales bacterium]